MEELALAATEIEDGSGSEGFDDVGDAVEAKGVEGYFLFNFGFFFGFGIFNLRGELGESLTGETALEFEIAGHDAIALGVILKPILALAEELFDFLLADPVVLLSVEDGDEDKEVLQERLESAGFAKGEILIVALTPVGEVGIERSGFTGSFVTEGREKAFELGLAAWCWEGGKAGGEVELLVNEFRVLLAGAIEGGAKDTGDRGGEERGGDEGAVVDVLSERPVGLTRAY